MTTITETDPVLQPLHREASVELLADGDGRTLRATFVPYGEIATVDDGAGRYRERFLPGAFRRQLNAVESRVKAFANYRHGQGIGDQIGAVRNVEETETDLRGEIRLFRTPNGDTALEMFREGLDKVSIEFRSRRHRRVGDIVERITAELLGVALVPEGAYAGAAVTGIREMLDEEDDLPQPLDPMLAQRLSRFITLPGSAQE